MIASTRRSFAAGLLAAAPLMAAPADEVRLPRRLRLGLIGNEGHPTEITRPLPRLPDIDLVAYSHPDARALASFRAPKPRPEPKKYPDYRAMLDQEKLDLVAVCNSNGDRAAAVLACAERRLNVISEKPLATERADLDRVHAAIDKSGVKLGMLVPMRFEPAYQALRNIVGSGAIGEVYQMEGQKSYTLGRREAWYKSRASYGGTIAWIGIHMIDLMIYTSRRDMKRVFSFQGRVGPRDYGDMEMTTSSVFTLDNGGTATVHLDYYRPESAGSHGDDRLRLAGSKGIAEYQGATGVTLLVQGKPPETLKDLPPAGSVFIDYLEWAYNGKTPVVEQREIWRANEITLAARDAAEKGRVFDC